MKTFTLDNLKEIFEEMFTRVGQEYSPEFTYVDNWYQLHTWDLEDEGRFKSWLTDYLLKNKLVLNKKQGNKEADMFLLQFGWKSK